MAPVMVSMEAHVMASREAPVLYAALKIKSLPSLGYELSFGTLLAKVSQNGCKFFYV